MNLTKKVLLAAWIFAALLLLVSGHFLSDDIVTEASMQAPSIQHWAGTDRLGRDVIVRTSRAAWHSAITVTLAEALGSSAAFFAASALAMSRRQRDTIIGKIILIALQAVPPLLIALTVSVLLRGVPGAITFPLAVLSFTYGTPVFFGEISSVRRLPQMQGATILGAPFYWRLRKYWLPAIGPRLRTYILLDLISLVAYESLFGFFGLADPTVPSLGSMLADSRPYVIQAPWLFIAPLGGVMLVLGAVWQINLFMEARNENAISSR
ncbi:MAG: hypothetical protein V1806_07640 [Pseudomonadota bacterium]